MSVAIPSASLEAPVGTPESLTAAVSHHALRPLSLAAVAPQHPSVVFAATRYPRRVDPPTPEAPVPSAGFDPLQPVASERTGEASRRAAEKQPSRDEDYRALASGEKTVAELQLEKRCLLVSRRALGLRGDE